MREISRRKAMSTITFISTSEAANIAGVSVETIRQLCKAETLRYQKRGQLYYPCKEDINRYADSISKVHSIRKDIERYAARLEKDKESLLLAHEEMDARLKEINMFPLRIERMQELIYPLLRQYEENRVENISERELELLFMMFRGETFDEAGKKLQLTRERVRQIWIKILRKLVTARNLIELRDAEISSLKLTIQKLQGKLDDNRFDSTPQGIKDNIDLLLEPISALHFSTRTERGLYYANINTVWDLVQCRRNDLRAARSMGQKSIEEIEQWLAEHNLSFEMTLPPGIDIIQLRHYLKK